MKNFAQGMYLCNDEHEEICYISSSCPVCEKLKEIFDFEDTIYDLKEEINSLKNIK